MSALNAQQNSALRKSGLPVAVTWPRSLGRVPPAPAVGVMLDVCEAYNPDDVILVVEGARSFAGSLPALLQDHHDHGAIVTVGCNADKSPAGIYALKRSSLDIIPKSGFMDMKEQWLVKL